MIDATGAVQSVLVLGATSEIAAATVSRLAGQGRLERAVLAGRAGDALDRETARVRALGVAEVAAMTFEATDAASIESVVAKAFADGDIDVVLVAFGVLPDQAQALAIPDIALASMQVNYLGAATAALYSSRALQHQGHGVLVVLSSVAAERPRKSNFVYGSAKAGLDALCIGLGEELRGSGASVVVVRPGFVHTAMTRGLTAPPLATTADVVAQAIAGSLNTGSRVIWVPGRMRLVMTVLRHVPGALFRRLPL